MASLALVEGEMFSNWRNTSQFDGKGSETAVKKVILVKLSLFSLENNNINNDCWI